MRHALGVLGVLAAGVLLAVSAAMNWRFGFQLGKTELDGFIYGSASAAADCLKALVPFFLFAAIRNRMWAQATAAAIVGVVVTAYSLTSALGHAALNRQDTAGVRAAQATTYANLQADLERAKTQLGWVPQHRPIATVQSEVEGLKAQKPWRWSEGCTQIKGVQTRKFCADYTALMAELGSAEQAAKLEERISDVQSKLSAMNGAGPKAADPQAAVLAKLSGVFMAGVTVEDMQTALVIFIALLLEVGSGLGMYIAFSQWRLHDAPIVVRPTVTKTVMVAETQPVVAPVEAPAQIATAAVETAPVEGANDNRTQPKLQAPQSDIERFYKERIETQDGSSLTATTLYEDYCSWCETQEKEPLALPTFGREFNDLGVQKAKIAGRVRYIGVALRATDQAMEDKKPPAYDTRAA